MIRISQNKLHHFSIIIALLGIFVFDSCQRISTQVPPYLEKVVENVRSEHSPDKRLELFDIQLKKNGDQLFILGETTSSQLKNILLDSLNSRSEYYDIIDSVKVLPESELEGKHYGIVYVSVANMRRHPKHSAELVNQVLLGSVLKLYKKEGSHYFAQSKDRYLGWVSGASMVEIDSVEMSKWKNSDQVIFTSNYGIIHEKNSPSSNIVVDLVPGASIKRIGQQGNWIKCETPDGRVGFIENKMIINEQTFNKIKPERSQLINTAISFLGVPYLWGGTSTKGFDCSGFVQNAFFMNKFDLPRDANQMVKEGVEIKPEENFSNLLPGDLLFFGPSDERITHVAIYLENQNFIHSDGWVHINSFDKNNPKYNDYRFRTFRKARRVLNN
jgi:gamma-D-glutamyl-L-lysine dipeptidyl-peptidase